MSSVNPTPPKAARVSARLVSKTFLTSDVIELHFASEPHFDFLPGQFISIVIPKAGPGGRDLRRAYSIASPPGQKHFELCVKLVEGGAGTQYLNSLKIGECLDGMAPFGDFIYKPKAGRDAVMVATGTGIAPFRSMIFSKLYTDQPPRKTSILFGARTGADLLYSKLFGERIGNQWISMISRPTAGESVADTHRGRVTDYLRNPGNSIIWSETEFYLCGNGAMIDEVKKILVDRGVEKTSIHQEIYFKPKPGDEQAS